MSNSPGQVPTPQQPQAPPQVSDKTIDAFMSAPQDKQREALGKMSEPTKQALLQGIKTRKGISTQPQTQPVEKAMPFSSGVATGMMLDPTKIAQQKTMGGQALEVGKQMASGALDLGKSILKDPLNVGKPIDAIVKGQESAYKKVHEGLKSGNHDELMNGLGEAVGNLSMLLGGAKTEEGIGVTSTAHDAAFTAKDLTAKRAIVSAASHAALDDLRKNIIDNPVRDASGKLVDKSLVGTAIDAERARIKGNVDSLNLKDKAASPNGYVPTQLWKNVIDQAISDKNATELEKGKALPAVAGVKKLMNSYGPNLTFDNLKDIRSLIGSLKDSAVGKDRAILGDLYNSASTNLKGRAAQLGGLSEWEDYNNGTEKLAKHQSGLISELKGSKTGLDFAKDISSEKNQGRLKDLAKDLHLPEDTFQKALKGHKAIINFAKMTEGDSIVAKTANRLIALKQHPIAASLGGGAGVVAGRAIGTAIGSPMAGSFIGLTLGAAAAHDLMSKYDAAKAIREIGGPSGVMGIRPGQAPASSGVPPSSGPGGGGTLPPSLPSGNTPPRSSPPAAPLRPSSVSPKLLNLLKPAWVQEAEKGLSEADKGIEEAKQRAEDAKLGKTPRPGQGSNAFDRPAKVVEAKAEPQVTKAAPEERGRQASVRKGMTKDTPEARRAKAAERITAKRSEASRTNIKGSLEDQARQVAGRMDFQGKSIPELEEGLQALYGENGKRFMVEFKRIAKQQKWSEEVYRGYIEDTLDRRAKELAQRPSIPGLGTEAKD